MKLLCSIFVLLFLTQLAVAQKATIKGKVEDGNGKALPFGTIYLQNTTRGTSANEQGLYQFNLEPGTYHLIFRFIGYQPRTVRVKLTGRDTVLNVQLQQQVYQLNPVSITNTNNPEDPARTIMRLAISNRQKYLKEVKTYAADVYMKGVQKLMDAPKKFLGENVIKTLNLDSNRQGILYLSESTSKLYYKAPDNFREIMQASKVSGKNESLSFNKATDLNVNLYENLMQLNGLSLRGFVSPVSDYAFSYYRYELLGDYIEDGQKIHKIRVIPRRPRDPVFSGTIFILDGSWRIHSADLFLTEKANINFVDTLQLNQQFIPVSDNTWMPSSLQINFKGKVLGFSFAGYFLTVFSNYEVNTALEKGLFNGETLKIDKDVRNHDEEFWAETRPVPLTDAERADYKEKDAAEKVQNTREYKDSVDKENNKLTLLKFGALGYTKTSTVHKTSYTFTPLLEGIFYNTVEGFGYQYQMTFIKEYNLKNSVEIRPRIRYGFSNQHINPSVEVKYFYDPVNLGYLGFKAGSEVLDISSLRSSISITNSINTLIYETNYRKFYEKRMLSFSGSYEAANGLFGTSTIEYSNRVPLLNTSDFRIIDRKNKTFTSNNPFFPSENIGLFPRHQALVFSAELDYAPAARYVTRPEGKFYEPFKYPRLVASYKKGFKSIAGSDVDFDFLSFEIYQNDLKLGLFGRSSYTIKAGRFLNRSSIYYPDFYHFRGNNSLIFEGSLRNFHFLDLYQYSTDLQFFEAHYEHNFGGFLVNKLPLVRRLKLEEIAGGAYLDQPNNKNYYEAFFGLQRLILRVDYSIAFNAGVKVYNGFRISYRLKGRK